MEPGVPLLGQSEKLQVPENGDVHVDLSLSIGQQHTPAPIVFCGSIIDRTTGHPLPDALVTLSNGPSIYRCRTTQSGKFEIVLPSHWSVASIQIVKQGYSTRYIGTQFLDRSNETFYVY